MDWWYIYIYDLIDYHIYKLLIQIYVLLFGVHIRGVLDKSFCRVTYKILLPWVWKWLLIYRQQLFYCLIRLLSWNLISVYMYIWYYKYLYKYTLCIVFDQELFGFWTAVRFLLLFCFCFLFIVCIMVTVHEWCIYTSNAWTSACPYVRFSAPNSCVRLQAVLIFWEFHYNVSWFGHEELHTMLVCCLVSMHSNWFYMLGLPYYLMQVFFRLVIIRNITIFSIDICVNASDICGWDVCPVDLLL